MKIVINASHGGFNLSDEALDLYNDLSGKSLIYCWDIERDDPNSNADSSQIAHYRGQEPHRSSRTHRGRR